MQISKIKNQQGGFLQLIVAIVVIVFLMKFFGLTVTDVVNWFKSVF